MKQLVINSAGIGVLLTSLCLTSAHAGSLEQAKRIHDRIAGVPPTQAVLMEMKVSIDADNNGIAAAEMAMENDAFYRVTIKNWAAPWTNEEQTKFVPLNDYIATVIGFTLDELDFREILSADVVYTAPSISTLKVPAYATNNNAHYEGLENGTDDSGQPYIYKEVLKKTTQSSLSNNLLPAAATAGVLTSRAAAKAFFKDGTNRAQFRFTLMNHLCRDLEQVNDITRVPDRIRQDVSRSPGGDARVFLNSCIGCHSGMDPLTQAFAYYDYDYDVEVDESGENGSIAYNKDGQNDADTGTRVQGKYRINSATFPYGYVTPNDHWDNYWREGVNSHMGWDAALVGSGDGAKSMGTELSHSQAFAECQVVKVFRAVCLREPENSDDRTKLSDMTTHFASSNYRIKTVFADAADYCKGE